MTSAEWAHLKAILADALEQREGDRQAFVENACGLRADLVAEALGFLRYAEETTDANWFGGQFALIDARITGVVPDVAPIAPSAA